MRFGVYVPNFGAFGDPNRLVELARDAESAGWDGFFLWDHLLLDRRSHPPMVDAWVVLSAIAASTSRLRIGPMITPLARRRPWKVAREATTLDHLSNGRLILGVGLGAPARDEFERFGEEPADRVRAERLDEGLAILAGLWSEEAFSHRGRHYTVDDALFVPPPVQRPRIPIWVAGMWPGRRPMERAARWEGAFPLRPPPSGPLVWKTLWLDPAALREIVGFLRERRGGLDGYDVVASGATEGPRDSVEEFAQAGATWWLEWLDEQRGSFEAMRSRVRAGPPR